jgi:hypothetical protein
VRELGLGSGLSAAVPVLINNEGAWGHAAGRIGNQQPVEAGGQPRGLLVGAQCAAINSPRAPPSYPRDLLVGAAAHARSPCIDTSSQNGFQ